MKSKKINDKISPFIKLIALLIKVSEFRLPLPIYRAKV